MESPIPENINMPKSIVKPRHAVLLPSDHILAAWSIWLQQYVQASGPRLYWADEDDFESIQQVRSSFPESRKTRPSFRWITDDELRHVRTADWMWADVLLRLVERPQDVDTLGHLSNWIGHTGQTVLLIAPSKHYPDFLLTRLNALTETKETIVNYRTCMRKIDLLTQAVKKHHQPTTFLAENFG